MKVRAVVDTNVFVSALIRPQGTAGKLRNLLAAGAFTAVVSSELIEEIASVLAHPPIRRKYGTMKNDLEALASILSIRGDLVMIGERIRVCRDPHDDFLLETAVAGGADYLVTGDEDLLSLKEYRGVPIVKLSSFLVILDRSKGNR